MSDKITEIFGYIVIITAAILFAWEYFTFKHRTVEDQWIVTPKRKQRRYLIALLVFLVGMLIICETKKVININDGSLKTLIFYVLSITGLAVSLIVLAIRDVMEMANNAQKLALKQLQDAIDNKSNTERIDEIDRKE